MHIGMALFCYFPYGGMQRDMMAIAHACHRRGHRISFFAHTWEGDRPDWAEVTLVPVSGLSNHARDRAFIRELQALLPSRGLDCLVGFNKMPGLDIYYAADSCFVAKQREQRGPWYRFTPRARFFQAMEAAVFGEGSTRILLISEQEKRVYQRYYQTPEHRMALLPPGIRRDRLMPDNYEDLRRAMRERWLGTGGGTMLLFVGSGFRTKGLDRALHALAALPAQRRASAQLFVIGQDRKASYRRLAKRLGVAGQVHFLGGRDDVARFLWAADVLIHPAYRENTGTVLLEAMVAGLPVLTTAACGYAGYVREWHMGQVIDEPFQQRQLDEALSVLLREEPDVWRERGLQFAEHADIYSLTERAADEIERPRIAAAC